MTEYQQGTIEELLNNVYKKLISDEILMRLLSCKPEGYDQEGNYHPNPLSDEIENIVDIESDEYWEKVDRSVILGNKISDLENDSLCRIYITENRSRPVFGNTYMNTQEFSVDIYIHEEYENEYRMSMISDRINELLVNNYITEYARVRYAYGNPKEAPKYYRSFYNVYEVTMPSRIRGSWKNHDRIK